MQLLLRPQYAQLTPGHRIEIGLAPLTQNRIAHALAEFHASFECHAADGGIRIVRTLEFRFTPAVRWLFEPLLRHRLEPEVREELRRAKQHAERQAG